MDDIERQRATKEARARAATASAGRDFGLLRYLATQGYATLHADEPPHKVGVRDRYEEPPD